MTNSYFFGNPATWILWLQLLTYSLALTHSPLAFQNQVPCYCHILLSLLCSCFWVPVFAGAIKLGLLEVWAVQPQLGCGYFLGNPLVHPSLDFWLPFLRGRFRLKSYITYLSPTSLHRWQLSLFLQWDVSSPSTFCTSSVIPCKRKSDVSL